MTTEKTEGLVIRQADFSETSRVVTLFTRDFGKISALAKGARRLKGPFESAIDLLSNCQIVFIRKSSSSLDLLTEARLLHSFRPAPSSLLSLYAGYYVAELLAGLSEEYDPHPHLYSESLETLRRLETADNPLPEVMIFETAVLREVGQMPEFDVCVACGEPAQDSQSYGFWLSQGGLICSKCQSGHYPESRLSSGSVSALRYLSNTELQTARRLKLSDQQRNEIRHVYTGLISQMLGHRPKMLRYFSNSRG